MTTQLHSVSKPSPRWWLALRSWMHQATCKHTMVFDRFVHSSSGNRRSLLRCLKCGKREKVS